MRFSNTKPVYLILEVGDKVIQEIPDIGNIHGEIESIVSHGDFNEYKVRYQPINYCEEVRLLGLVGYNKKCGCNFWCLNENEDGSYTSFGTLRHMIRPDIK